MVYKIFTEEELFKQEFPKIFQKNKCVINNCKKKTICFNITLDFLNAVLSNSIEKINIPINILFNNVELEKFLEIKNNLLNRKQKNMKIYCSFCIQHEYSYYKDFVFAYPMKEQIESDIDLEKIEAKNFIEKAQDKFIWTRFLILFFRKIYTLLCFYGSEKDLLLKSLKNDGLFTEEGYTLDSEKVWFLDINYYCSFPIFLRKNTVLSEYNGKNTTNQGKNNGPDFILKNIKNNKTIGLEIVEYQPLAFNVKNIKNIDKFIKTINPKINENMNTNWEKQLDIVNKIIVNKLKKSEQYKKTDELFLGVILNHKIEGYRYYLLEFWSNLHFSNWKYNTNNNVWTLFNEIMFL